MPDGIDHSRCEHHDAPCSSPCTSPLRQPLPAPTITGIMYLGTVPGDLGIYILPNRSREQAIGLHGVESLALGPPPPKHQHQHIPGDRRSHAPDGGKKAHQHPLAYSTIQPTVHLPKDSAQRDTLSWRDKPSTSSPPPYTPLPPTNTTGTPLPSGQCPHHRKAPKTPSPSSTLISSYAAGPPLTSIPPEWK